MTAFNHIALHVSNLETSRRFYEELLQLPVIEEPFKQGRHLWFDAGNGIQVHLIADRQGKNTGVDWHFAFSVPNLNHFIESLDAAKISYGDLHDRGKKISVRPDGIRQTYFQDPDGYWIEVNGV